MDFPNCNQNTENPDAITAEEKIAISQYKEYQIKYLPNVRLIEDLYLPDFSADAYPGLDTISALRKYQVTCRKYTKRIVRAAKLRQQHYENHIMGKREEEHGHKAWREGMNALAIDCTNKLEYWSGVHEAEFDKLLECTTDISCIPLAAKNTDYVDEPKNKKSPIIYPKRISAPKLSARQAERIREEYRKQLIAQKKHENAIIDEAIKGNDGFNAVVANNIKEYGIINYRKMDPSDYRDLCIMSNFDRPELWKDGIVDEPLRSLCTKFRFKHDRSEMLKIVDLYVDNITFMQRKSCEYYGCCGNSSLNKSVHHCKKGKHPQYQRHFATLMSYLEIVLMNSCCSDFLHKLIKKIVYDHRLYYESDVIIDIFNLLLSYLNTQMFIRIYNNIKQIHEGAQEEARTIVNSNVDFKKKSSDLQICMSIIKNCDEYMITMQANYLEVIYDRKTRSMLELIEEKNTILGLNLEVIDTPITEQPKDSLIIKKATGILVSARAETVKKFNAVKKKYLKVQKQEIDRVNGVSRKNKKVLKNKV